MEDLGYVGDMGDADVNVADMGDAEAGVAGHVEDVGDVVVEV
jgi:hypothetical protein